MRWIGFGVLLFCGVLISQQEGETVLTKREREAVEKFYRIKMRWAEELVARGHADSAIRVVEALLLLGPPTRQLEKDLISLRKRFTKAWFKTRLVDAYLALEKRVFVAGERIVLRLVIASRSEEPLILLHPKRNTKQKIASLNIFSSCYMEDGTVRVRELHGKTITKTQEVTLHEGEAWMREIVCKEPKFPKGILVAYKYLIAGVVNIQVLSGKRRVGRLLPLDTVEFLVIPATARPYIKDAFTHLVEGLKKASKGEEEVARMAVFYGGILTPPEKRVEAVGVIISWLPRLPHRVALTATAVLSFLTNKPFGADIDAWIEWWKSLK